MWERINLSIIFGETGVRNSYMTEKLPQDNTLKSRIRSQPMGGKNFVSVTKAGHTVWLEKLKLKLDSELERKNRV